MALHQKTWMELLGYSTKDCKVLGKDIVHITRVDPDGTEHGKVLWHFDTGKIARDCFQQWIKEIQAANVCPTCGKPSLKDSIRKFCKEHHEEYQKKLNEDYFANFYPKG